MGITKVNKNLIGDSALDSDKIANNSIGSDEILDMLLPTPYITTSEYINLKLNCWWCNRFIEWWISEQVYSRYK